MTRHHDVDRAIVATSAVTGIPVSELIAAPIVGGDKNREVTRARQAAMVIARMHTHASLTEVGACFRRSARMVINAVKAYGADERVYELVTSVEARFYGRAA